MVLIITLVMTATGGEDPNVDPGPATAEGPTADDLRAKEIFTRAASLVQSGKYAAAVPLLETLVGELRETRVVRESSDDISSKLATCREKIAEREEAYRTALKEAQARMSLSEWAAAKIILEGLGTEAEVVDLLKSCSAEIDCGAAIATARAAFERGDWDGAATGYRELLARFPETQTLATERPIIDGKLETCRMEVESTAALNQVLSLAVEKKWAEVLTSAREAEARYGRTRTFIEKAGDLRQVKRQAMRVMAEATRREADALLAKAMLEKVPDSRKALLLAWMEEYEEAEFFPEKSAEVAARIAECDKTIAAAREKEAVDGVRAAARFARKKEYEKAIRLLQSLVLEYEDTKYVRSETRRLADRIASYEKKLGRAVKADGSLFDDFRDGGGKWSVQGGSAGKSATYTVVKKGRRGKNALRVVYPGGNVTAQSGYAYGYVGASMTGMKKDVKEVRIWVRLEKGERMRLSFDLYESVPGAKGAQTRRTWRTQFMVTGDWKEIRIDLSKMQLLSVSTDRNPKSLDLSRVTRLSLYRYDYVTARPNPNRNPLYYTNNDPAKEFVVLVDEVRFAKK